jgi:hypothetical protein
MRPSIFLLSFAFLATSVQAQPPTTFSSGSTGADGPLTYAQNLGTLSFPPATLGQRVNNIYNFTTITIGAGTTVRLSGWVLNGPVYWLATGDVVLDGGVLDLSGTNGRPAGSPTQRSPNEPGPGGFSGGVGQGSVTGQNAAPGSGPGGGSGGAPTGNPAGGGGTFTGNNYLQPLIGGSGGGGAGNGGGGGAGGGAILIASSTQITVTNNAGILANGGSGYSVSGGGSGGAVRLVANTVSFTNNISGESGVNAAGGSPNGGGGIIRLEAFTETGGTGSAQTVIVSTPVSISLPTGGTSTINVTKVNNIAINANPFSFPDVTINTGSPVPVIISGVNIPPGTTGNLYIYGETTADQVIPFTLTGTLQSTAATVSVSYPSVGSRGFAKVTWTGQ